MHIRRSTHSILQGFSSSFFVYPLLTGYVFFGLCCLISSYTHALFLK